MRLAVFRKVLKTSRNKGPDGWEKEREKRPHWSRSPPSFTLQRLTTSSSKLLVLDAASASGRLKQRKILEGPTERERERDERSKYKEARVREGRGSGFYQHTKP